MWRDLATWWRGGDLLMPVMLAAAVVLYTLVGERAWALFGPPARRPLERDRFARLAAEAELTRGLGLIRVLAGVLPLLGLLGTVSGMVETFSHLSHRGGADRASGLGGGVAMALTATQYGLALAIPAVVADWLLRRRAAIVLGRA
jgi:biopolymer transport protein ExbB